MDYTQKELALAALKVATATHDAALQAYEAALNIERAAWDDLKAAKMRVMLVGAATQEQEE